MCSLDVGATVSLQTEHRILDELYDIDISYICIEKYMYAYLFILETLSKHWRFESLAFLAGSFFCLAFQIGSGMWETYGNLLFLSLFHVHQPMGRKSTTHHYLTSVMTVM